MEEAKDKIQEQINELNEKLKKQSDKIEELNKTIKEKDLIIKHLQRLLFGKRSEKLRAEEAMANMPMLFELDYPEPRKEEKEEKTKKSVPHSSKKYSFDSLEHRKVLIEASEEEKKCPWCGEEMVKIGEEFKRYRLVIKRPEMFVEEIYTETYSCSRCTAEGAGVLFKTKAPSSVIPHSYASSNILSMIVEERFCKGVPYARLEDTIKRNYPFSIRRNTMSNWMMYISEHYFEPFFDSMHESFSKSHCATAMRRRSKSSKKKVERTLPDRICGSIRAWLILRIRSVFSNTNREGARPILKSSWKVSKGSS